MKKFAVFDIDGTLIRWQLYHAVVDRLAKNGKLAEDSHTKIHLARMRWKNREVGYSFQDYEQYLVGTFEKSLKQLSPDDFESTVEQVIEEYKDQTYSFTRDLMKKLKQQDYALIAISGSQQELIEKIAQYYGFDVAIGTKYDKKFGKYSGEKVFPAHDKQKALRSTIKKYDLNMSESYATGDSLSDSSMLEIVEYPIAFNPDNRLYEVAKHNHWPIVIERKNVIYRLEYKKGSYVLAETNR